MFILNADGSWKMLRLPTCVRRVRADTRSNRPLLTASLLQVQAEIDKIKAPATSNKVLGKGKLSGELVDMILDNLTVFDRTSLALTSKTNCALVLKTGDLNFRPMTDYPPSAPWDYSPWVELVRRLAIDWVDLQFCDSCKVAKPLAVEYWWRLYAYHQHFGVVAANNDRVRFHSKEVAHWVSGHEKPSPVKIFCPSCRLRGYVALQRHLHAEYVREQLLAMALALNEITMSIGPDIQGQNV